MRNKFLGKKLFLTTIFLLNLLCLNGFSQTQPTELDLNKPVESEIKGGETQSYSVLLEAGKTARIEIVQNGVDVSLTAVNPNGEKFIMTESPSGYFGDDLILVTATETGIYLVEITPANPRARPGKYTVLLKEIRPSVTEDFAVNEAAGKLTKLAEAATVAKYKGTDEGKREALEKWDKVIELSKIKKDRVWEGIALTAQGLIYEQLGEIQKTLDAHLKSLEIWRETGNRQYEGSSLNNIATIHADLGEHEKAISYFEQALKIQEKIGDRNSIGIYLNNLAYSYMSLEDYEKAEELYRKAIEIKRENESIRGKRSLAATLNNLGKNLALENKFDEGIAFLEESLKLRREIEFRWGIANSLLNLGEIQWKAGQKETGIKNLEDANVLAQEVGDRRMAAQTFYLLAIGEREKGNLEKAIENVVNGLDIVEAIRSEFVGADSRYAYFSTVQNFYELYTDLLVSRFEQTKNEAYLSLALEMSERSRSRSLVELLQEAKVNFRQGLDTELLEELKTLQKTLNEKYAGRQSLLSGKPEPEQVEKINKEINALDTQIQNLKIRIRRENPKYADLSEAKTISVAEIQNLLDERSVLLEYKLGEIRSFLWFVTKDSIDISILPPRKEIEEKAKDFYEAVIAKDKNQEDLSKDLSRILFKDVGGKFGNKTIVLVADGILQYTPFSALTNPEGDELLVDSNEIVVLPSAAVLAQLRANPKVENAKTIAIFADPVFDKEDARIARNSNSKTENKNVSLARVLRDFQFGESLPRLLSSRQEAKSISKFAGGDKAFVKTDFEASLKNIEKTDLADYRILHFATHGLLNTKRPELSGLVFSLFDKNGKPQEGFLSLNDIYNLDLESDLVVLSACQTALGKDVRGEGLVGISRGFLYAGSNRIIASLWKVDDSATAEFMKIFYRNHLEKGLPASASLQKAKIEMKKIPRYRSPFYWSAFTLLGDWK